METKRTQIAFDVHPDVRLRIKLMAAKRNISMNLWLMRAIYIALRKEEPSHEDGGKENPPSENPPSGKV